MLPVFVGALMYREITFGHFAIGYAVNQKKLDRKKSGRPNYSSVFGKTLFFSSLFYQGATHCRPSTSW